MRSAEPRLGRRSLWCAAVLTLFGCGRSLTTLPKADPLFEWEAGRSQYERGNWVEAQTHLKRFLDLHPGHARADSAQLLLGLAMFAAKSYAEAAVEFTILGREYPRSELRDDAAYHECTSYFRQIRSPELDPTYATRARGCYEEMMLRYPESTWNEAARERIGEIDDHLAEKDYKLGVMFAKMKRPAAARIYLAGVVERYPHSRWVPAACLWLGRVQEWEADLAGAAASYRRAAESASDPQVAREAEERHRDLVRRYPEHLPPAAADSTLRP